MEESLIFTEWLKRKEHDAKYLYSESWYDKMKSSCHSNQPIVQLQNDYNMVDSSSPAQKKII